MSVLHVELLTLDPYCACVTLGTGYATGLENMVNRLVSQQGLCLSVDVSYRSILSVHLV